MSGLQSQGAELERKRLIGELGWRAVDPLQGAELERKRLIGELGWRAVDPLQASQALENSDPEDLRIRLPEQAWSTLRGPEDLRALNAFQKGDLSHLGPWPSSSTSFIGPATL